MLQLRFLDVGFDEAVVFLAQLGGGRVAGAPEVRLRRFPSSDFCPFGLVSSGMIHVCWFCG